ncbi:hypothetical protein [Streptomyces sp. NPDC006134]|uniref:hypothetical protein n=1 Tax=Streptomyces sp. NPDC006134 TaxID=3154467 RepID=UPI0034073C79
MPITQRLGTWAETVAQAVTDENLTDIITTAAYGGVTYWAVPPTKEDFDTATADTIATFVPEGERPHHISARDLRKAYIRMLAGDAGLYIGAAARRSAVRAWTGRTEEDGIDTTHIDADAADQLVQLACFGKVVF